MSGRDTGLFLSPLRCLCNIFIGNYEIKKLLVRSKSSCEYDIRMDLKENVLEDVYWTRKPADTMRYEE